MGGRSIAHTRQHLSQIVCGHRENHGVADRLNNAELSDKMLLARAFSASKRGEGIWEVVAAINTLRNGIAHSLDEEHKQKQFQRVRELYLGELEDPELRKEHEAEPDHLRFLKAYALCEGYLRRVEEDAHMIGNGLRSMIGYMRDVERKSVELGIVIHSPERPRHEAESYQGRLAGFNIKLATLNRVFGRKGLATNANPSSGLLRSALST